MFIDQEKEEGTKGPNSTEKENTKKTKKETAQMRRSACLRLGGEKQKRNIKRNEIKKEP